MTNVEHANERCAFQVYYEEGPALGTGDTVSQMTAQIEGGWFWACGCRECLASGELKAIGPFDSEDEAHFDFEQGVLGPQCELTDAGRQQ